MRGRKHSDEVARASIYGLRAVDTDTYFYVGSTKRSLSHRLSQHLGNLRLNRNLWFVSTFYQIGIENVVIDLLETVPKSNQFQVETRWIKRLLAEGHHLTNLLLNPSRVAFSGLASSYPFSITHNQFNQLDVLVKSYVKTVEEISS